MTIENIESHMAYTCSCGGVNFALLKSGEIECNKCGAKLADSRWGNPPAAAVSEPVADKWRDLALRFDAHRMSALAHLRMMVQDPTRHIDEARKFLTATPPAEAKRKPLTEEQIINAMCEDGCERIESFYVVGPVQKAAVWSFAQAIHNIGAKEC